jgi:hypothetical protein
MPPSLSHLVIFAIGLGCGILIAGIGRRLHSARRKRTEMVTARARILADIKERHDEEILHEAFRTTEAIRSELGKSLQVLRKTLIVVRDPAPQSTTAEPDSTVDLAKPIRPNESPT